MRERKETTGGNKNKVHPAGGKKNNFVVLCSCIHYTQTLESNKQNPRDRKSSKMTNALFHFFGLSVNDRRHDFAVNDLLLDDRHPLLHDGFGLLCKERTDLHSRFSSKSAAAQSVTDLVNQKGSYL